MEDFKVPVLPAVPCEKKSAETIEDTVDLNIINKTNSADVSNIKTTAQPTCPYHEPKWSALPSNIKTPYKFEVLKSGQIIEEITDLQNKAVWKFGRLPINDMELAHPTISRFHAVLQYRPLIAAPNAEDDNENKSIIEEGWYIYDLGSTHGTFLNKQRIPPKTYIRIKVGHMLRLGASTRSYILQGPTADEEPESELTVTELISQRQRQEEAKALEAQRQAEAREKEGINWGMTEDADEETDLSINPYASTNNEELFLDDPKRTLRGFFEREGLTLEYKCDEMSAGSFVCRVELPVDDTNGKPIVAEVVHKGRKKDCVVQCALEACRILDRHGVLRQANQEPLKRKTKTEDSDEDDDFWDRTGDVEKKKLRKANNSVEITLTYEDLLKEEKDLISESERIDKEIIKYQELQKRQKAANIESSKEDIDLDNYMKSLNDDTKLLDKTEIKRLRNEQQRLQIEQKKIQRLLKVAKPIELPFNNLKNDKPEMKKPVPMKKQMPMIGKRNQFSKFKIVKPTTTAKAYSKGNAPSDEEEMEDEETEDKMQDTTNSEHLDEKNDEGAIEEKPPENFACREASIGNDKSVKVEMHEELQQAFTDSDQLNKEQGSLLKKRHRHRQRMRNKRTEIDIDELATHESTEKYAKWVPPENQTGDGITELNKKFGY